jgi:hypothetical protein
MILGRKKLVIKDKANFMKQFECNDCGHLKEYVGNKIEYVGPCHLICSSNFAAEL